MSQPSITCPKCHRTSYNANDIRTGYCGMCHDFTSNHDRVPVPSACPTCHELLDSDEIARFRREQREALLSLDEQKIRAFAFKWNATEMPSTPVTFWGAVHKAITAKKDYPLDIRRQSKAWLTKHNYQSWDDGDL